MTAKRDLKTQLLFAALDSSNGDINESFTFEQLLVAAWKRDPVAWGLRGFEREHPDSERIHRELDSRGKAGTGLVALGYLEKVKPRVYRITPRGLAAASSAAPEDSEGLEKAGRALESDIRGILEHEAFQEWIRDPGLPRKFREVGHLWGVAPGTPPRVARERFERIEHTLEAAQRLLDETGTDAVQDSRRKVLFDREDIKRCQEFQGAMRERFSKEIELLTRG